MSSAFFDTNVIVYLTSADLTRSDTARRHVAIGGTVSVQVLNEFALVAKRKLKFSMAETTQFIEDLLVAVAVVPVSIETHRLGLAIAERHRLHIYDSMIVAAAQLAGCTTLYSEDVHDGLVIDGLKIVNPFK